jgi:hypothetical protein
MITEDMQTRLNRLDTFKSEGRIIRHEWEGIDDDGHEVACLLATLSPEAGRRGNPSACPAGVMPAWFANLTPWIDDSGSVAAWPSVVERYAALAHRWHALSADAWVRLHYAVRAAAVSEAMQHTTDAGVLKVCNVSLALCLRAAGGDMPTSEEFGAAESAAEIAAESAARSAADRMTGVFLGLIEAACDEVERAAP